MLDTNDLEQDSIFNKPRVNIAPQQPGLGIDLELTNHCNAHCYYCPRELVAKTGFMTEGTFKTVVDQASIYPAPLTIFACGHGESLLHPDIGKFITYARQKNLGFGLQTNGSLLTDEKRKILIDSGLNTLRLSISALGELHEQMYQLKFEPILKNVKAFIREAAGSCNVGVYIVQTDLNKNLIRDYKTFWEDIGVDHCDVFPVNNRSGSIPSKNIIYTDSPQRQSSQKIFNDESFSDLCVIALSSTFIGHDGNYYLCANDWEKQVSIGHVSNLSLHNALILKAQTLSNRAASICNTCDMNIHNRITDALTAINSTETVQQLIGVRHHEEHIMRKLLTKD